MIEFRKLYRLLIAVASSLQPLLLLAVRLYWGWQFMQTGWGKLHRLDKVTQFFTSLGIPAAGLNAGFVSGLELVGGVLLAMGLVSRPVALLFVGDMLVAYITADRAAFLSFFSDPDKFVGAAPCTFLCASLLILIFGPGRFSLDALADRWFTKRRAG
ncbi:MAG: DoxX family protein [Bryobacteraceae bacterium]|jgi:putative oxidoreductase